MPWITRTKSLSAVSLLYWQVSLHRVGRMAKATAPWRFDVPFSNDTAACASGGSWGLRRCRLSTKYWRPVVCVLPPAQ